MTASGGVYFSDEAYRKLRSSQNTPKKNQLTLRQLEILSICAAYPDVSTAELGQRLGIASSTLRNLLSSAYLRLDVRTRSAAIARAQQLGLLVESNLGESKVND
jgi:DNA-binding CsgD family transcriptional regulator